MFDSMTQLWIKSFQEAFSERITIKLDPESLNGAAMDYTEDLHYLPQALVEPDT